MEDAQNLVPELELKLQELNDKVSAYQRDMLAEFDKHLQDRLRSCPPDIAVQVARSIAESMSKYPALRDLNESTPPTPTLPNAVTWDGRGSPPPVLHHTSGIPKEPPRSPHARDEEFHNIFTPGYLPLLDSRERSAVSSPSSSTPLPISPAVATPTAIGPVARLDMPMSTPVHGSRPAPFRRQTDRSASSIDSSSSEARTRRSALRRSSSSAKGSPRRVRFEFQGVHVLPSSSPQASTILGPPAEAEPHLEAPADVEQDESQLYCGPSLLDQDGEEEALPRPKKVSSTQALRALSQQPLDATTVWTVVNADPEGSNNMPGSEASAAVTRQVSAERKSTVATDKIQDMPSTTHRENIDDPEEGESSGDEGFLSMGPQKFKTNPATSATKSHQTQPNQVASGSPQAQIPSTSKATKASDIAKPASKEVSFAPGPSDVTNIDTHIHNDEDLFDFEAEDAMPQRSAPKEARKYIEEEDEPEPLPAAASSRQNLRPNTSAVAGSLPVRRSAPVPPLLAQSVGSYKGNPVIFGPMSDPKLYQSIANMRDVHLFVGSVDGRSGPDAADMNSYRATLSRLSGAPRSFSEKLAFEEMMEEREAEEAEASVPDV